MSGRNILYLFESAVGIGHQRRASGIVNGLVKAGFNVFVASGTFINAENYFLPEVNLIYLPEPRRNKDGVMCYYNANNIRVADPDYNDDDWKESRIRAIQPFAESTPIDAVFAEWWPFQRRTDFDPIIAALNEMQIKKFQKKPMIVSSLRDVIQTDNKEIVNVNGEVEKSAIAIINSSVDLVLVHGDQNFLKLEEGVENHNYIKKPVIYTGYVVDENAMGCSLQERNQTVLVSCGSGHDGHYMMHATLRAMLFSKMAFLEWHYVLGPRMQPLQKKQFNTTVKEILDRNPDLKIVIHDQLPQFPKFLSNAAFSISLAGYNTTIEVLVSNTPSVLIPKFTERLGEITKIEGEQWDRLMLMKEKKMANIVHPEDVLMPEKFADIMDCAYVNRTTVNKLNINGISNTAELMKNLLLPGAKLATKSQNAQISNMRSGKLNANYRRVKKFSVLFYEQMAGN